MQELRRSTLHHIGFAVRSSGETRTAFEALGARFFHAATDERRNLDFLFADLGGVLVELVSPHDPLRACAVTGMVEKRPCMPYHVCLEVPDLDAELERLKHAGYKQMGKIITSDVYGYEATGAFLFGRGIGLIEIIQRCGHEPFK